MREHLAAALAARLAVIEAEDGLANVETGAIAFELAGVCMQSLFDNGGPTTRLLVGREPAVVTGGES